MMAYLKTRLLSPWGFSRIIRLALGIVLFIQAMQMHDVLFGLLGSLFLGQAILNSGCGAAGCNVPVYKNNKPGEEKETLYEEIKNNNRDE